MKDTNDLFSLVGKTILVTGATGYLGKEMVLALAKARAHVLINSRSDKRCIEMVDELKGLGYNVEAAVFDVTDKSSIDAFNSSIKLRALDGVIHNAYNGRGGTVEIASAADYIESYNISVVAAHNILNVFLPKLREAVKMSGGASFVNISSMYGLVSPDQRIYEEAVTTNPPFYGAAKAAMLQWTRYVACEFGLEGIRCNSITPGPFPSTSVIKANPEFVRVLADKVPLGRVGHPKEITGAIIFLLSNASSYVNGSNLVVDGGWTAW
ncbi:SDR family oxidoreductase [Psychrobacter sp. UBA3480]|uniref:SDR family NAD(P)-dependent oxidoreductase n=1 Tax=unclassified Psychrobacter TaxID=196806 RepID=UPI0025E437D1|nr:SDR family oxidoreductase [Psychrobacter sp. UBA3480]